MNELGETYYNILEVSKNSSIEEIKASFRRLAHKYHPDKNFGDKSCENKFRSILIAYETLSDSENRIKYDSYLNENNSPKFDNTNQSEISMNDVVNILNNLNAQLKNFDKAKEVNVNLLYNILNDLLSPELIMEYLKMTDITRKDFIFSSIIRSFIYLPVYLIEDLKIKIELIPIANVLVAKEISKSLKFARKWEIINSVTDFFSNTTLGYITFFVILFVIWGLIDLLFF
jgi:curved DNA-binding protein CbpA